MGAKANKSTCNAFVFIVLVSWISIHTTNTSKYVISLKPLDAVATVQQATPYLSSDDSRSSVPDKNKTTAARLAMDPINESKDILPLHQYNDSVTVSKIAPGSNYTNLTNATENATFSFLNAGYEENHVLSTDEEDLLNATSDFPLPWTLETRQELLEATTIDHNASNVVMLVDDKLGRIEGGRLVVRASEKYAFWKGGQQRLCTLLRNVTFTESLEEPTRWYETLKLPPPLLNVTMDCKKLNQWGHLANGHGNWITAIYCVRIAAALARVDFQFQCNNGRNSAHKLLLPWFDGYHPAPTVENPWPFDGDMPSDEVACTDKYKYARVDTMSHEIQKDIRRMAIEVIGSRAISLLTNQTNEINVPENHPLIPDVVLDDVAIHYRCGDIMGGTGRGDYGIVKYTEYPKWIWNSTQRIGIVTQPFDKKRVRSRDKRKTQACRKAVHLLVNYLQGQYPNVTINIHNGPNETLPLAFARLASAKQSFTSLTTFGIFPIVGTFGHGYFQKGNEGVNPFATHIPKFLPNVHEMTAPVLSSGRIRKDGMAAALEWFVAEE